MPKNKPIDKVTTDYKNGIMDCIGLIQDYEQLTLTDIVVPTALLDWFDENYIENREECSIIVVQGTIDYPFTPEQLKEWCLELKKTMIHDESLYTHIKLIGELCNVGVPASIAGKQIRDAIIKTRKQHQ